MATCGKERETDFPRTLKKKKKHAYYGNSDAPDSGIFCETLAKLSVSLDSGKHLGVNNPRNNNWKQEERQPNFHWIGEIYISAYKIKEITIWFCQNLWILGLRVTLNRTVTYCTCLKWFAIIYVVIHSMQHRLIELNSLIGLLLNVFLLLKRKSLGSKTTLRPTDFHCMESKKNK